MAEGKEGKEMFVGGSKMFSFRIIKKPFLLCYSVGSLSIYQQQRGWLMSIKPCCWIENNDSLIFKACIVNSLCWSTLAANRKQNIICTVLLSSFVFMASDVADTRIKCLPDTVRPDFPSETLNVSCCSLHRNQTQSELFVLSLLKTHQ